MELGATKLGQMGRIEPALPTACSKRVLCTLATIPSPNNRLHPLPCSRGFTRMTQFWGHPRVVPQPPSVPGLGCERGEAQTQGH